MVVALRTAPPFHEQHGTDVGDPRGIVLARESKREIRNPSGAGPPDSGTRSVHHGSIAISVLAGETPGRPARGCEWSCRDAGRLSSWRACRAPLWRVGAQRVPHWSSGR